MFTSIGKFFNLSAVKQTIDALTLRERDPRLKSNAVQWLYWAAHGAHTHKFERLMQLLEDCKTRALTSAERGLLIDALAFGHTNVTPARVEWTFKYAPRAVRSAALRHVNFANLQDSVEEAVVAATPLDPSLDENYERLWRRFDASTLKDDNAYNWSMNVI